MTVSYPLAFTFVDVASPSDLELSLQSAVRITTSPYTGREQKQVLPFSSWVLRFSFPPLTREEVQPLQAFLAALNGREGTFLMGPQGDNRTPLGTGAGSPRVAGAGQVGGNSLVTDGWAASQTVLKAGDYFSIDNRLYQTLTDTVSSGAGVATIDCAPYVKEHANNAVITLNNPVGTFRLQNDLNPVYRMGVSKFYSIQFEAVEDRT